jgi:hypothetical protein
VCWKYGLRLMEDVEKEVGSRKLIHLILNWLSRDAANPWKSYPPSTAIHCCCMISGSKSYVWECSAPDRGRIDQGVSLRWRVEQERIWILTATTRY